MGWRCCKCYRGVAHGPHPWCACGHFRCHVCQSRPFKTNSGQAGDLGETISDDGLGQDGDKRQEESATEVPKQVMSSWDHDMVMIVPHAKKEQEESGNEQEKGSANLDKQAK